MPAEKTVTFWASPGTSPTMSIPSMGLSSLSCWKPISASPRATTFPTGSAGIISALPRTFAAIDPIGDRLRGGAHGGTTDGHELVSRLVLPLLAELEIRLGKATRDHHLDFGSERGRREEEGSGS